MGGKNKGSKEEKKKTRWLPNAKEIKQEDLGELRSDENFLSFPKDKSLFWCNCDLAVINSDDKKRLEHWKKYLKKVGDAVKGRVVVPQVAREKNLNIISNHIKNTDNNKVQDDVWIGLSKIMAERASGVVFVVTGDKIKDTSIWNTTELPTLMGNNKVTHIVELNIENPDCCKSIRFINSLGNCDDNMLKRFGIDFNNDVKGQIKNIARKKGTFMISFDDKNKNPTYNEINESNGKVVPLSKSKK